MPTQLQCNNLRPGDILLKHTDGGLLSTIITAGQRYLDSRENAKIAHAGIMFDNNFIIESQGRGLVANDLRTKNKSYGYIVYRCKNADIAKGAGEFAKILFDSNQNTGKMQYALKTALLSVFKKKDKLPSTEDLEARVNKIFEGRTHKFFCSQFVAFVYQFVAEQNGIKATAVINLKDTLIPASRLATLIAGNAAYFDEAGYIIGGER